MEGALSGAPDIDLPRQNPSLAPIASREPWDSQPVDFGAIAGCSLPSQYDLTIEDRDQPEKRGNDKAQRSCDYLSHSFTFHMDL